VSKGGSTSHNLHVFLTRCPLLDATGTKFEYAQKSFSIMMLIFPELESSLNIAFHNPSRKGRSRFPKAQQVVSPPVEKSMWDQISLEGKIKKHVQEVASIYITKVPSLMAKLEEAEEKKRAKWRSFRTAVMKSYGMDSRQCQHHIITEYLSGRYDSKEASTAKPHDTSKSPDVNVAKFDTDPDKAAIFPDIKTDKPNSSPFDDTGNTNPFEDNAKPTDDTGNINPFDDNTNTTSNTGNTDPNTNFEDKAKPTDDTANTNPFDDNTNTTNNTGNTNTDLWV
jgi:hypothetical protein